MTNKPVEAMGAEELLRDTHEDMLGFVIHLTKEEFAELCARLREREAAKKWGAERLKGVFNKIGKWLLREMLAARKDGGISE